MCWFWNDECVAALVTGALPLSMACGCAGVSSPYPFAREMIGGALKNARSRESSSRADAAAGLGAVSTSADDEEGVAPGMLVPFRDSDGELPS